jgi:hypothetical protein
LYGIQKLCAPIGSNIQDITGSFDHAASPLGGGEA